MTNTASVFDAFLLSCFASLGTLFGGVLVLLLVKFLPSSATTKTDNLIGTLQAAAAGVMMFLTFLDLIPESVEQLGKFVTLLWFFYGVLVYFAIDQFIVPMAESQAGDKAGEVAVQRRRSGRLSNKGSPTTIPEDDHIHTHTHHNHHSSKSLKELQRASLITFIAMAAHNVPEGLGVFFSALSNYKLGAKIAVSICLHNLPEGMALGIPIWAATRSVSRVLWLTFLNGLAEPIGVLIGGFLLKDSLNEAILCKILAGVGGMMACISMVELYPAGIRFSSKTRASIAFFVGMALTFVALELVASSF